MLGVVLAACGNNTPASDNQDIQTVGSTAFDPANVTLKKGDSVTFINKGGLHSVKFKTVSAGVNAADLDVSSSDFAVNTPKKRVLNLAGEYEYYCQIHATPSSTTGMVGRIMVNP
ncbi:MAG TPA: plastocyanin/azurin family copper-binding protein [Meiothermus sp.]|nr:plastocyanin/azurin family copper-binding protein [Meiothermus sp.]